MKRILFFLCFTLPLFLNISGKNKAEKLLLGGSGWNKIVIIDKRFKTNRVGTSFTKRLGM